MKDMINIYSKNSKNNINYLQQLNCLSWLTDKIGYLDELEAMKIEWIYLYSNILYIYNINKFM